MTFSVELQMLTWVTLATALMWVPYILARIYTRGLMATLANPAPSMPADPAWAQRAKAAHANAIENLAVFAPLVLVAAAVGVSTPATVLATQVYVAARLVHYVVYAAGIPVVRTLAFFAGIGAAITVALAIMGMRA